MKILTISIAAYNVEKYLEYALDSICNSSIINDVEVIIVDDGSKDGTGMIGKKYAKKYPLSIISVSKENGGHGSTINVGLKNASGKYFRILDGDDWLDTDGLAKYVEKLKLLDTDIVISNKKLVYPDKEEYVSFDFLEEGKVYSISEHYPYEICTLSTMAIKTKLIKKPNIKITEKSFYVDMEFVVHSILCSKTFGYVDENVYMYRRGLDEQSVSKKSMLKNVEMLDAVNRNLYSILDSYNVDKTVKDFAYKRLMNSTGALYRTYFLEDDKSKGKKMIMEFETYIKKHHNQGFIAIGKDRFIRFIRCKNYFMLPIMRIAYRIKCKKEKLI